MKYIANSDFSQGPQNPLKRDDGSQYVKRGDVVDIGGELPIEKLPKEQYLLYSNFISRLFLLDSDQGRQIQADCQRLKNLELEKKRAESARNRPHKYWYEKPIGLIGIFTFIGVVVGVVVFIVCEYLKHKFSFFHSASP